MFRIKICGVTSVDDAQAVAEAGADAIGLNFYASSPRYVDLESARTIARSVPPHLTKVGLFVNEPVESIRRVAAELDLEFVQLHGHEPPELLAQLAPRKVLRAFRVGDDYQPLLAYLRTCQHLGCPPAAVLADALVRDKFGGTGEIANWDKISAFQADVGEMPIVLAGGLTPENVAEAIRRVRPAAVDVASGVECVPGRKGRVLVGRFVRAALSGWESLAGN